MDKDLFYISLFFIISGVGGQLVRIFFGANTVASFHDIEGVSGYMMLIGFLLLPAGLFKDGLPSPGTGAKIFIGIILILIVGVAFTSVLLLPSAQSSGPVCTPSSCATVNILLGSSTNINSSATTFSPRTIYVILNVNSTVKWINTDTAPHTVFSGTVPGLKSNLFSQGQFYEFTFTQPGNYSYICSIHPWMHGFVIVKASASG